MRIAHYIDPNFHSPAWGVLNGDCTTITRLAGAPFEGELTPPLQATNYDVTSVRLLAPTEVATAKVVAVGKNYADHIQEMGGEAPQEPLLFFKPSTAIIGPSETIKYPSWSSNVHYEGELAVIIGSTCSQVAPQDVPAHILGFTCANDVTARDKQRSDGQWTRAKGFDTSCPLGPWILIPQADDEFSVGDAHLRTVLRDTVVQDVSTSFMIRPVYDLISFISQSITLKAGDVVLTGTPAGVGELQRGDMISVEIDGIGTLTNPIA